MCLGYRTLVSWCAVRMRFGFEEVTAEVAMTLLWADTFFASTAEEVRDAGLRHEADPEPDEEAPTEKSGGCIVCRFDDNGDAFVFFTLNLFPTAELSLLAAFNNCGRNFPVTV